MDTPGALRTGAGRSLYGDGGETINRRLLLLGGLAALAVPVGAAPRRVSRLWWRGTARVETPERTLDLTVETTVVVPSIQVRSASFITAQGPQTTRTLILEPDGVWLERAGTRTALPPQLGVHERQQYAIYAWLLFVQQAKTARRQAQQARSRPLRFSSPPWPDITFDIGSDGYPVGAALTVEASEAGEPPIAEQVRFTGRLDSNGVRWPRRFDISQAGKPYFGLDIAEFRAS